MSAGPRRLLLCLILAATGAAVGLGAGPAQAVTPLTVQITSPTAGTVLRGATAELDVHVAGDAASTGHSVQADVGGDRVTLTRLVDCADQTDCDQVFSFSTIGAPNGDQPLHVTVMNSLAQLSVDTVQVTVDNPVPVASNLRLTTPMTGNAVYGTVGLKADATEEDNPLGAHVVGVRFYSAGTLVSEDDEAPYTATTTVTPAHPAPAMSFGAQAVDSAGDVGPLVRLDVLAETPPTIDSVFFGPGESPGAWGIHGDAYVDFHAAAMPSGLPNQLAYLPLLNYLASEQLSIDGVVRDTATPSGPEGSGLTGNCRLGCPPSEDIWGYNLVPLTAADAGWHTVVLRVTDVHGGYSELTRRVYFDPGPTLSIVTGRPQQQVASGSVLHVAASAVAGGSTSLQQTDVAVDGTTHIANELCNEACGQATVINGYWHVPALATGAHTITFSAWSSTSVRPVTRSLRVVVRPSTQTTVAVSTRAVHAPTVVTFAGTVNRLGGSGLPSRVVALQYRPAGSPTWRTVRTGRTDSGGHVTFAVGVSMTTQWRLAFPGEAPYLASSSPAVTITRH